MTPSSFSRPSTASPAVPYSVHPSIAARRRPTDHRPRDDISRRHHDATNSRPSHLDPQGLNPSTTASSRHRIRPTRNRPTSPSSSTAIDVLKPILRALFSILQPSEGLLGTVDAIRRQVADALHAAKATSTNANAQPAVRWWCPCCHHHHDAASCSALARVSPCSHCGQGHSNRSCPTRRALALERADAQQLAAQRGYEHLLATNSITFGDMTFPFAAAQSPSEVAKVERTTGLRSPAPAKRTVAPQSPAAAHHAQPTAVVPARGDDVASHDSAPNSAISAVVHGEMDVLHKACEITTDALPNQQIFDAPVIVPVTTIMAADCSTQTDSPDVGVQALLYSSEVAPGERTGVRRSPKASTSSPATAQHLTPSVSKDVSADSTTSQTIAAVPVTSSASIQGEWDCVIAAAAHRHARRQPGASALPVELFALGRGHNGCCSVRQCSRPLYGAKCYVATLDTRSFSPFKGYCVCEECRDSSDQWQRLFPHPVLLHESPDMINKANSVCSEYLTGPRYIGCCAIATCGGPLTNDNTDEVFATDFDPRSLDPLRVLRICKTCRFSTERNMHRFFSSYMMSSHEQRDYRSRHRIILDGTCVEHRDWDLPDKWASTHPNSLQDVRRKCLVQFVYNYGLRLLTDSLHGKPVLPAQQVQEHFRTTVLTGCDPHRRNTVERNYSELFTSDVQAALPTVLSTGFDTVTVNPPSLGICGGLRSFQCTQCHASAAVEDFVKHAGSSFLQYFLLSQHARHDPLCKFFEQLKRESRLPELFFPDIQQHSSERKFKAALRALTSRRTKFLKSLEDPPEFSVVPPPGDPAVHVFNPWTRTNFDEVYWNAIVPSCTYTLA